MTAYPLPRNGEVPPDAKPTIDWLPANAMRWDVIAELVRMNGWAYGAEVGCADGRTADRVLKACPGLHLLAIDPWAPQPGHDGPEDWADWPHAEHERRARQVLARYGERCRIVKGRSEDVAATVEPGSLDFVFLDGDHGEEGVRRDISAWLPAIRPGGMILIHDINWPGPQAALAGTPYEIGPNNMAMVAV